MNIIEFTDEIGNENIIIENEDGSTISMLKSVYDEMVAKQNQPTGWVEPQLTKF